MRSLHPYIYDFVQYTTIKASSMYFLILGLLKTIRNTVKIAFGITYYKQQKTFSKDSCIAYFLNSKKKKKKKKEKEKEKN